MSLGVLAEPTFFVQALAQLLWPPRYFGTPKSCCSPQGAVGDIQCGVWSRLWLRHSITALQWLSCACLA